MRRPFCGILTALTEITRLLGICLVYIILVEGACEERMSCLYKRDAQLVQGRRPRVHQSSRCSSEKRRLRASTAQRFQFGCYDTEYPRYKYLISLNIKMSMQCKVLALALFNDFILLLCFCHHL